VSHVFSLFLSFESLDLFPSILWNLIGQKICIQFKSNTTPITKHPSPNTHHQTPITKHQTPNAKHQLPVTRPTATSYPSSVSHLLLGLIYAVHLLFHFLRDVFVCRAEQASATAKGIVQDFAFLANMLAGAAHGPEPEKASLLTSAPSAPVDVNSPGTRPTSTQSAPISRRVSLSGPLQSGPCLQGPQTGSQLRPVSGKKRPASGASRERGAGEGKGEGGGSMIWDEDDGDDLGAVEEDGLASALRDLVSEVLPKP